MPASTEPIRINQRRPHLILCGCGPGEIIGWAFPILDALGRARKRWRVSLVLWPRLFSSGREASLARDSGRFDTVLRPSEALRFLPSARFSHDGQDPGRPLILHLGGPSLLSLALGRRLRSPVVAYAEKPLSLARRFQRIYCTDADSRLQMFKQSGPTVEIRVAGNLIVDAVQDLRMRRSHRLRNDSATGGVTTIAILPGSRGIQLRNAIAYILPIVKAIKEKAPGTRCLIARSPFVSFRAYEQALEQARAAGIYDRETRLLQTARGTLLAGSEGITVPVVEREEALLQADILVSSPGTNSAEATALAIPMVLVAPFDPDSRIFTGPAGIIERLPWIGRGFKRGLVALLRGRMRYYSHANNRAGREIVPEIRGAIDTLKIADTLVELVNNRTKRERMRSELEGLLGPAGAARLLVQELAACFEDTPAPGTGCPEYPFPNRDQST